MSSRILPARREARPPRDHPTRRSFRDGLRALGLALLAGCSSIPFEPIQETPVAGLDPIEVRDRFRAATPERFRLVQSVVFEFGGRALSSLGMLEVDAREPSFRLSCMTPMGVKLFDLRGTGDETSGLLAAAEFLEVFGKGADVAAAVGRDIRRIYFDRIPGAQARIRKERTAIVFEEELGEDRVEYRFGGPDAALLEKRISSRGRLVCHVGYYEYRHEGGALHPGGVVLDNRQYGYRLILRLRQVRE